MRHAILTLCLALIPATGWAEAVPDTLDSRNGTLNPRGDDHRPDHEGRGRRAHQHDQLRGGLLHHQISRHVQARELFEACANDGWTGAMAAWMSQMENNGLGAPENPDAAADLGPPRRWAGRSVGQLNYGLDLMRGRGVRADEALGRAYVGRRRGRAFSDARRLQAAGYDLDEVTPDADNWKYAPLF